MTTANDNAQQTQHDTVAWLCKLSLTLLGQVSFSIELPALVMLGIPRNC